MDFPPHSSPGAMSCSDRNTHHPLWPLAHPHLLSSKFWQWTNGSGQLLVIEELDCWNGFSWLTEMCGLVLTSWTPGSWGLLFLLLVVCGVWLRTLGKWSVFILKFSSFPLISIFFLWMLLVELDRERERQFQQRPWMLCLRRFSFVYVIVVESWQPDFSKTPLGWELPWLYSAVDLPVVHTITN